jgi:hypothetical protein
MVKHERDDSSDVRSMLSQIFSPLILALVRDWQVVPGLAESAALRSVRCSLYLGVAWVLEGFKKSAWKRLWKGMGESELEAFWSIMLDLLAAFEFSPKLAIEHLPFTVTAYKLFKRDSLPIAGATSEARRICAHMTLSVLDWAELFLASQRHGDPGKLVALIGPVLVQMLALQQGSRVLHCIFDSLHCFVLFHRREVWTSRVAQPFAQALIKQTLRLCNSDRKEVRAEAAVLLYLALRTNHVEVGHFERSKVLATTAVTSLVATEQIGGGGANFRKAMSSFMAYGLVEFEQAPERRIDEHEVVARAEYAQKVQGMALGLIRVLDDTFTVARVRATEDAPTVADLYLNIVRGYDHIPDLRVTWLRALADFHTEHGAHAEAGMCLLRSALQVLNYLTKNGEQPSKGMPRDLFKHVLPGVEEYADVTENCQTSWFTEDGYATTLESAAASFVKAQMYEYAEDIYLSALLPLHESCDAYSKIAVCHSRLASFYQKIEAEASSRFLGRFFRVGFYGTPFKSLNGQEFVYRGQGAQHLFELKDLMTEHFEKTLRVREPHCCVSAMPFSLADFFCPAHAGAD